MLTGMRVFVSARVAEAGEVIVIPRESLRRLIATDPGLGDTILAAFMARRSVLMAGASATTRLIGSRFCPLCLQVREFLARSRHPLRVAGPRQRPRRWRPCWSSSASTPTSCPSSSPRAPSCAGPARAPGRVPGSHAREPARALLRPRRRRRRSRRPGRRRLRRHGGAQHAGRREVRRRRAGGVELAH